jgi:hypothetical protein
MARKHMLLFPVLEPETGTWKSRPFSSSPFPASIKGYYPKPRQYNPELSFMTF